MTDSALLHKLQDEQYLYRLSSTFAWDEAIEFCNRSILGIERAADSAAAASFAASFFNDNDAKEEYFDEYLDSHIQTPQTAAQLTLYQWVRYVFRQITFSDQWGNTPLHSASFCKPPVDMIMALFRLARTLRRFSSRVNDSGISESDEINKNESVDNDKIYNATNLIIWGATCKDSSTPFLVASSTGASTEVLHCYLDEIQYYIDNDWSNENNLKEWARKTVIRPDSSGNTPLMGWMAYYDVWIKRQLDPSTRNTRELSRLSDYWELAERMLQFATKNDLDDNDHTNQQQPTTSMLVQQCASISLYCPISLLEWVVSPHRQGIVDMSSQSVSWTPADVCAATPDRTTGKLPFHVAMEAKPFSFDLTSVGKEKRVRYTSDNPRLEKNRIQMIKKLLTWYPDAVTVPFQLMKCENNVSDVAASDAIPYSDKMVRSRSPFLQAIAFGMTWWQKMNTANCNEEDHGHDYMGIVQLLWRLNAGQTTSTKDDVSGLYPFMLAAATATTTLGDCHNDRLLVDTTYNLLKKDPELVTGALIAAEK